MKLKKRLLSVILLATLALSLSGCRYFNPVHSSSFKQQFNQEFVRSLIESQARLAPSTEYSAYDRLDERRSRRMVTVRVKFAEQPRPVDIREIMRQLRRSIQVQGGEILHHSGGEMEFSMEYKIGSVYGDLQAFAYPGDQGRYILSFVLYEWPGWGVMVS